MDGELGVAAGARMNRSLVRRVSYIGAVLSFSSASRALEELLGLRVSSSEIQRVVHEEGARIEARHQAEEERWNAPIDPCREAPEPRLRPERLVIEADATCVPTLSGEEHKSVYCATAFALDSRTGGGEGRAMIGERAYAASASDMDDFSGRAKALAWRMGMRTADRVAFVGDGARCLWKWAEGSLPAGTVYIQDFWHVCEHLAALARDLFGERFTPVYHRWKKHLRAGKVGVILRDLVRRIQRHRGWRRERLREEITYLEAGRHRMDLPTLRARRLAHRLGRHRRDLQAPGQRTLQRNRRPVASGQHPPRPGATRVDLEPRLGRPLAGQSRIVFKSPGCTRRPGEGAGTIDSGGGIW